MKFKDKNGNIFIPTSKFMEDKMKNSNLYTEVKEEVKLKVEKQKSK